MTRLVWKNAVLGSLNGLALVLAARLTVLIATGGAIFLAWLALGQPDSWNRIAVLSAYLVGCLCPLVWLASRK